MDILRWCTVTLLLIAAPSKAHPQHNHDMVEFSMSLGLYVVGPAFALAMACLLLIVASQRRQ